MRELHSLKPEILATFNFVQSPVMLAGMNGLPEPPLSYAEILLRFGYLNEELLHGLIAAWRSILKLLNANVIVASHAPTAMLAARTLDIPVITVGSGFCVPPRVNPVPNMRPWMPVPTERLAEADRIVTKSINTILEHYARPPLGFLAELFDVQANLLCTFPEFDHYQPRIPELQRGMYVGPIIETRQGEPLAWPDGIGKKVLVYLRPETRDWEAIMHALADTGCRVIAAIPGISESQKKPDGVPAMPRLRPWCSPGKPVAGMRLGHQLCRTWLHFRRDGCRSADAMRPHASGTVSFGATRQPDGCGGVHQPGRPSSRLSPIDSVRAGKCCAKGKCSTIL